MGLYIAAGILTVVVTVGLLAAFRTWNDPKNDLRG